MDSKQITEAMRRKLPVVSNGIEYQRITEYILWFNGAGDRLTSVNLLDKNGNSLTRVPADAVELATKAKEETNG